MKMAYRKQALFSEVGYSRLTLLLWYSGLFLISMAFLFPILSGPWPSFYKESCAAIGLTLLALAFPPRILSKASAFLLLLALTTFFYYLAGHIYFIDDVILTAGYIISLALSIEIGRTLIVRSGEDSTADKAILGFWVMIWITAAISSLIAIRQWLGIADSNFEFHLTSRRPYGNVGQPNLLSSLLFMAFAASLYFHQKKKASLFISLTALLFFTFSLAVIQSRISWLFIAFLGPYLAWRIKRNDIRLPYRIALLIPVFFVFSIWLCLQQLHSNNASFDFEARATQGGRLNIWSSTVHAIPSAPLEGFGWRQTVLAQQASPVPVLEHSRLDYAHSIILDLIIWLGPLFGTTIIIIAGAWLLLVFFRSKGINASSSWIALSGLLIHALFEYPHAFLYILIPFGIIMGTATPYESPIRKKAVIFWCISSIAILTCTAIAIHDYRIIERDAYNEKIRRANIAGFSAEDMSDIVLLQQLAAERQTRTFSISLPLKDSEESLLSEVTTRRPTLANLVMLALAQTNKNKLQSACTTLALTRKLYGTEAGNETFQFLSARAKLPCSSVNAARPPPEN